MKFSIQREVLLKPLQMVIGVVEKRQNMLILANVLLSLKDLCLSMTSTDLEVELIGHTSLSSPIPNLISITAPGRKLLDICRVLPEKAILDFYQEENGRIIIRSGRSRFAFNTLPAEDFPDIEWETEDNVIEFTIKQDELKYLLESTHFSMAQQDVRYYLNGLLLEIRQGYVSAIATDGHRLAMNSTLSPVMSASLVQIIIPRKGVIELLRLLGNSVEVLKVSISGNHVRVIGNEFIFTSKLIKPTNDKFLDYEKAIPKNGDKIIIIDRNEFKQALVRVSVLSNDMFRGVRLQIQSGIMHMATINPEQEEAEEDIAIDYQGEEVNTGFNINYLLDILANIKSEQIVMTIKDGASSTLIEEFHGDSKSEKLYVVMPLRL